MNISKIIATCLLIGGLIANGVGVIVGIITLQIHSWISWINFVTTTFGVLFLIVTYIPFSLQRKYNIFNYLSLSLFSCIIFPILLLTSPDGVFISYLSLLAPAIGLLHYNFKKYYIVGIVSLIEYWIVYIVKIQFNINMLSGYMLHNYLDFLGGITATYIFSVLVSTISMLKLTQYLKKDALTGVLNRGAYEEAICKESITFGVMIDVDHFKQVNDSYGHKVGDLVLKSVCDIISSYTKEDLKLYRYGGEEFVLLSSQEENDFMTSLKGIWIALNWQLTFKGTPFTVSMGVAKKTKDNSKSLIIEADQQLYKAKENGRHRVYYNNVVILCN